MSADHKRPLYAFAAVALICAVIIGHALDSQALVRFLAAGPGPVVVAGTVLEDRQVTVPSTRTPALDPVRPSRSGDGDGDGDPGVGTGRPDTANRPSAGPRQRGPASRAKTSAQAALSVPVTSAELGVIPGKDRPPQPTPSTAPIRTDSDPAPQTEPPAPPQLESQSKPQSKPHAKPQPSLPPPLPQAKPAAQDAAQDTAEPQGTRRPERPRAGRGGSRHRSPAVRGTTRGWTGQRDRGRQSRPSAARPAGSTGTRGPARWVPTVPRRPRPPGWPRP